MGQDKRHTIETASPKGSEALLRRGLLRDLTRTQSKRLTTIVAPPGYGKTSLAKQWFGALTSAGTRTTWLTLSAEDENPARFFVNLARALGGAGIEPTARAGDLGSLSVSTLVTMVRARSRSLRSPVLLFLDDFHLAGSPSADGLIADLLADPTCRNLNFVLISRYPPRLPLSDLRLIEELRQLGPADLRFSRSEAIEFLGEVAARLDPTQVAELLQHAEGWPVALQMVRVLIRESPQAAGMLSQLGRHPDMGRFLSERVISSLPVEVQDFLLRTAALPEFSAELAVAVCGTPGARDLFFRLDDFALPQASMDETRHWIRFHPVFRDFLQEAAHRRGIDARETLLRAAAWFESQKETDRAVRHALLAGQPNLAAGILERAGGWRNIYQSFRGSGPLFRELLDAGAKFDLCSFPLTALGIAIYHVKAGQTKAAAHYLRLVEFAADPTDLKLARQIRVVRALLSLYADTTLSSVELSALETDLTVDRDLEQVHRGLVLNLLSFNFLARTQLDRAIIYGELAFRCMQDSGAYFGAMHQHLHIGQAAYFSGNTALAEETYQRIIGDAQDHIGPGCDLDAIGQVLMAELRVQRGEGEAGTTELDWAMRHVARHDGWFDIFAAGFLTRQTASRIKGDLNAAQEAIVEARRWAHRRGFERLSHLVERSQAQLLLASGSIEEAARCAERSNLGPDTMMNAEVNDMSLSLRGSVPATFWLRWLVAKGDLGRARQVMDWLRTRQAVRLHVPNRIELDLIDLRLALAEGRGAPAATLLADLLLAVPVRDFAASFLIEGPALLADLENLALTQGLPDIIRAQLVCLRPAPALNRRSEPTHPAPPDFDLPELTLREREILQLISAGRTNKEIGRELNLTDNTVKFHLRNVFGKLRVNTRTAALSAARHLGMLH